MKKTISILLIALLIAIISVSFSGCRFIEKHEYKDAVVNTVTIMNENAATLDECGLLLLNVWHNAIYQERNNTTDKYTLENGKFVNDFNDALDNLYLDDEFINKLNTINDTQKELRKLRIKVEEPPKGAKKFNEPLLGMMDNYIKYSNIILNVQGSYNDVCAQINKCNNDFGEYASQFEAYEDEIQKFAN